MTLPISGTLLVIAPQSGNSIITLYSSRGLKQTLTPIKQASQSRRTINGALKDISAAQFRQYAVTITCTDQKPLALDGLWPGQIVTVSCVTELAYRTIGGTPQRAVVAGSSYVDGDFTFYRPQLTMQIVTTQAEMDEWKASVGWRLDLEEVAAS